MNHTGAGQGTLGVNEPLRIRVTDGPVVLRNAPDSGVNASYPLWDDIRASEFFPSAVESAYYVVALEKAVNHANQARLVEKELIEALPLIAAAWSFSGGSHLMIDTHKLISAPRFESNAGAVEGLITSDAFIPLEILSTYVQPPLAFAIPIAKVMRAKPKTRRLVQYYYKASIGSRGSPEWFINLYKIRDMVEEIYGKKITVILEYNNQTGPRLSGYLTTTICAMHQKATTPRRLPEMMWSGCLRRLDAGSPPI